MYETDGTVRNFMCQVGVLYKMVWPGMAVCISCSPVSMNVYYCMHAPLSEFNLININLKYYCLMYNISITCFLS